MTDAQRRQVRDLNDLARTAMGVASRLMQTQGVNALPAAQQSKIREAVETFSTFNRDNDPHREHDFGRVLVDNVACFWKIDCYDLNYEYGSEVPWDPAQTRRVLTIMLTEEY